MDETEEILDELRNRRDREYEEMDEECSELEDDYDDWLDATASIIGSLWVPGVD